MSLGLVKECSHKNMNAIGRGRLYLVFQFLRELKLSNCLNKIKELDI